MDPIVQAQDEQRTARSFISFLSTAMGVDQTYASQDGYAVNMPRQYQSIGPNGLVGVEGTSRSSGQMQSLISSPVVLLALAAAVAFLVLKK